VNLESFGKIFLGLLARMLRLRTTRKESQRGFVPLWGAVAEASGFMENGMDFVKISSLFSKKGLILSCMQEILPRMSDNFVHRRNFYMPKSRNPEILKRKFQSGTTGCFGP